MKKQSQHELFAQRPVRSDFARRSKSDRGLNLRKVILICVVLTFAIGLGVFVNSLIDREPVSDEMPTVHAELPIKQRPEQPGGIDIPHQDVTVFQQLDNTNAQSTKQGGVEHLLPEPETPKAVADTQTVSTTTPIEHDAPADLALAPQHQSESKTMTEELPPAITAAEPVKAEPEKPEPAEPVEVKKEPVKKEPQKKVAIKEKAPESKAAEDKVATALAAARNLESKAKTSPVAAAKIEPSVEASLPKEFFTTGTVTTKDEPTKSLPSVQAPQATGGKTIQVQLASYPNQTEAEREVKKFQSKYAGILGSSTLHVVRADIPGKGTYYRLMAPASSAIKAKAICTDIVKQKGSCIVVK